MNGFVCGCCKFVFPLIDACTEYVPLRDGGPGTRYGCPECLRFKVTPIHVCPECQREELVTGEDLGRNCLIQEQDALEELQLDRYDTRVVPFRRAS